MNRNILPSGIDSAILRLLYAAMHETLDSILAVYLQAHFAIYRQR